MVTFSDLVGAVRVDALLAVEEAAEPLIERLDPPRRAAVTMAILGLVLLGVALVACVMIGGRWARRVAQQSHGRTTYPRASGSRPDRSSRQAGRGPPAGIDQAATDETAIARRDDAPTTADE